MFFYNYSLGIDVSKDKLDCCIGYFKGDTFKVISTKRFNNTMSGFKDMLIWIKKKTKGSNSVHVILEATGVYYENVAHFIHDNGQYTMSILLPIKAKYWMKSLNIKSKTDKIDSIALSHYGLVRKSEQWEPISDNIRVIKQLSRAYRDTKKTLTALKNKLHAKTHAYRIDPLIVSILKENIAEAEKQCSVLESRMEKLIKADSYLDEKIEKLVTIPGVGKMTATTVVSETNGFKLIKSGRQLSSYAGLDVIHNDSGNKRGRPRLSKKGNKYIRQAMYMPALSGKKHMAEFSSFYERINAKKVNKKPGLLAVARKMLVLMYTLWKNNEVYVHGYLQQKKTSGNHEEAGSSSISTRRVEKIGREEKVVEAV